MKENKKRSEMTEEEIAAYNYEVISTPSGQMTQKEYDELIAPEIRIDEDYKNERMNELFGIRSKTKNKDKDHDRDR